MEKEFHLIWKLDSNLNDYCCNKVCLSFCFKELSQPLLNQTRTQILERSEGEVLLTGWQNEFTPRSSNSSLRGHESLFGPGGGNFFLTQS